MGCRLSRGVASPALFMKVCSDYAVSPSLPDPACNSTRYRLSIGRVSWRDFGTGMGGSRSACPTTWWRWSAVWRRVNVPNRMHECGCRGHDGSRFASEPARTQAHCMEASLHCGSDFRF